MKEHVEKFRIQGIWTTVYRLVEDTIHSTIVRAESRQTIINSVNALQRERSVKRSEIQELLVQTSSKMTQSQVFLLVLLFSPLLAVGQFVLPFLYMPLKSLFPESLGSDPKHFKVTSEHVRIRTPLSLQQTYEETTNNLQRTAGFLIGDLDFSASNLTDLDYYWSYNISFNEADPSLSNVQFVRRKTAGYVQEQLLKIVSQKFSFQLNTVASVLSIQEADLWTSYNPAKWEILVHAMINESLTSFTKLLELPSVHSLADLVGTSSAELRKANLSRFEALVFPFIPKKAILDAKTTLFLINSLGVTPGRSYMDVAISDILEKHENITLTSGEFGILYNLTNEQSNAFVRATFSQIFHLCNVSSESIKNVTLPEVSHRVVGSVHSTPLCPLLISIKGKIITSFAAAINPNTTTLLEILTTVSNLTWREVRHAVDASLPDWEFLDSVTLLQLAKISGHSVESLLNNTVSEAVELVLIARRNGNLTSTLEAHRLSIRNLLVEKFDLPLIEVANLTKTQEASMLNYSSPLLFSRFLNATMTYFGLNLSEIMSSVQVSEAELFNLPRQEWMGVISAIFNPVLKAEASDLEMSTGDLLQLLGIATVEPSISKLKELINNQILLLKEKKRKFETNSIDSVSDPDYLNTTVLSLAFSVSGYSSNEIKLIYGLSDDQIFILGYLKVGQLPLYCSPNTSDIKNRTAYSLLVKLVGNRAVSARCHSTRFFIAAREKNMSVLQTEYISFTNSNVPFLIPVENSSNLPWRLNAWAFDLKMEDWTVLYVVGEDSYKDLSSGNYESKTLLQIFKESVQLQEDGSASLLSILNQKRGPTLNLLYGLFETNETELIQLSSKTKPEYDLLYPIEMFSLMIDHYLVGKFGVSVDSLANSLDVKPGDVKKFSPTEWPEMIPFIKAEIIRSGERQLNVSRHDFAKLLHETPESLQSLTLAQMKAKWDSVVTRLVKGKQDLAKKSLREVLTNIGMTPDTVNDEIVLTFIEQKIAVTKVELVILYNLSSIAINVLNNYTFVELPVFCSWTNEDPLQKKPLEIVFSLLGHNNDMSCRSVSKVAASSFLTVDEWAAKFGLQVNDTASLLLLFEDLFKLPWPKIAWAVNVSLADWPILGALNLTYAATLTSQSTQFMKRQKTFREITMQLLDLPVSSSALLLNEYRSNLVNYASHLFSVNSSKICVDCNILDILWNSVVELNSVIPFDPYTLPNALNVSRYEFNLTLPSKWPIVVQLIVCESYSKAASSLGMDRDQLSTLLQTKTTAVLDLNLTEYIDLFVQSIQPIIDAKFAFRNSPLADLVASKGLTLSSLHNDSVFDVIVRVLSVSAQDVSFIFNWTGQERIKLQIFTLKELVASFRNITFENLGSYKLLELTDYVFLMHVTPSMSPTTSTTSPTPEDECNSVDRCSDDSLCQNYHGGFECVCKDPGYFKVDTDATCKPSKTFSGTLTILDRELNEPLRDRSTKDFYLMKKSFETTVNDTLRKSPVVGQFIYGIRLKNFRSGSIIVDFYIFTRPDFFGKIQDLKNALIGQINNSTLGPFTVNASKVAVEDFDECEAHEDNCGHHATCVNNVGSFECKCKDGFEGDGISCEGGFFKTMWWTVIIAALLLLLMVIIIVCLVIKRPKPVAGYGVEYGDAYKLEPSTRTDSSKVSYRSGDVYYKDKEGNLRHTGTAHWLNAEPGSDDGPHTLHSVEDDGAQGSNGTGDKTPLELAMEMNKRKSGEIPPRPKTELELAAEKNARHGNVYEDNRDLKLSELPIASIMSPDSGKLDHRL
ncbi:PREDICTED: uncharacterized protein LOC107351442 isoform X1 [Acropora digitifera]|uniref:uncharacterized protein LOC107351442 isoform X1 n=1 Tax=Acropora digitifera TaxID=70779 RepID=UPI00077A3167|nr:PREDICTED: uncharacterized protein LOC107351442 isoform X1 [Acropora digitifera]